MSDRMIRHSPLAIGSIITALTRGLKMGIAERAPDRERAIRRDGADAPSH
jgi:hypothetical protein